MRLDTFMQDRRARMVAVAALTLLGLLCIFFPDQVSGVMGYQWLNRHAGGLVDDALSKNQKAFLSLSGIKAGLAVIEGSSVGVGFQLEIGDVVQPALDYVDFFWRIFLFAFIVMGAYKLLMETGLLDIGFLLIGVGVIALAIRLGQSKWQKGLWHFGKRCIMTGMLLSFIVPVALVGTHYMSGRYTSNLRDQYALRMAEFQGKLDMAQDEIMSLKEEISLLAPIESIEEIRNRFTRVTKAITQSFNATFYAFVYYAVLLLFDMLFFPLLSGFIIYKFSAFAFDRMFGKANAASSG